MAWNHEGASLRAGSHLALDVGGMSCFFSNAERCPR
jgi:hypothetical protein